MTPFGLARGWTSVRGLMMGKSRYAVSDRFWEEFAKLLPERVNTHRFGGGRPRRSRRRESRTGEQGRHPPPKPPWRWTKEDLKEAIRALKESIKRRARQQRDKEEEGRHRERMREEEALRRYLERLLQGCK
jgi:hypothetical protein